MYCSCVWNSVFMIDIDVLKWGLNILTTFKRKKSKETWPHICGVSEKVHYYICVSMSVCVFSVGCVYGRLAFASLPSSCLHTHSFSRNITRSSQTHVSKCAFQTKKCCERNLYPYLAKHHLLILRLVIQTVLVQTNFTTIKLPISQNASHNVIPSV